MKVVITIILVLLVFIILQGLFALFGIDTLWIQAIHACPAMVGYQCGSPIWLKIVASVVVLIPILFIVKMRHLAMKKR